MLIGKTKEIRAQFFSNKDISFTFANFFGGQLFQFLNLSNQLRTYLDSLIINFAIFSKIFPPSLVKTTL